MLDIKPLTPELLDHMGTVLRGSWGSTCWCMYPRWTEPQMKEATGDGRRGPRRREEMASLAGRENSPGLLAFEGDEPVGWVSIAPRHELNRIVRSRVTPPVDNTPVWVIPCITVRKSHRGRGIAIALIQAAVKYAGERGAPFVEAYPRADGIRTGDDNAYYGTEAMFKRAHFEVVREPPPNLPRNWVPRVTMRIPTDIVGE